MDYMSAYKAWCENPALNEEGKAELASVASDPEKIEYRFGAELEFGTAGMRGIIGYGTNMMNVYTVRRATQGLAEYVKSLGAPAAKRGVVISYDTRRKSAEFARASAEVLAANGITAYLFDEVHPVPMLSYAVRRLGTVAGIMITASHNPKEYNGYKVYGEDGAQMSPEATDVVVGYIEKITDYFSVKGAKGSKLIKRVPSSVDKSYYKKLTRLTLSPEAVKRWGRTSNSSIRPCTAAAISPSRPSSKS